MGRERREFSRTSGLLDPKLIVIATEGHLTETKYFEELSSHCRNVSPAGARVLVLERTEPGESAPNHVFSKLTDYEKKNGMGAEDEFWMVIDRDRWTDAMLAQLAQLCDQKQFQFAMSNPCFELWLLLHHLDPASLQMDEFELKVSSPANTKASVREYVEGFDHTDLKFDDFKDGVVDAVLRCEILDVDKAARWPNTVGSRVYRLVQKLL